MVLHSGKLNFSLLSFSTVSLDQKTIQSTSIPLTHTNENQILRPTTTNAMIEPLYPFVLVTWVFHSQEGLVSGRI